LNPGMFCLGEKTLGKRLSIRQRAQIFYIDTNCSTGRNRTQGKFMRMRNIELESLLLTQRTSGSVRLNAVKISQEGLALWTIAEAHRARRTPDIGTENRPELAATDDESTTVFFKAETPSTLAFLFRKGLR
jgi:hypothetical protein